MSENFGNFFARKPPQRGGPAIPEQHAGGSPPQSNSSERKPTYSKVFRWRLADGQTPAPKTVEVAGTFNHWQKIPLLRDSALDAWHVTLHHIPAHRTHHYMLFVDGQPTYDKSCDGYAIPHGATEESYALSTPRGPRLLMLFAQTK